MSAKQRRFALAVGDMCSAVAMAPSIPQLSKPMPMREERTLSVFRERCDELHCLERFGAQAEETEPRG